MEERGVVCVVYELNRFLCMYHQGRLPQMKYRLGISLYVHKLPEVSDGAPCSCVSRAMTEKETKDRLVCDITPTVPHWFKLPIIPSSRARRVERI